MIDDFIYLNFEFIYVESLLYILINNLYKNLQKWIWLKSCFEISFLSIIVAVFADLKFDNYFWVDVNVIAGLKFWFSLGVIENSVFDNGFWSFFKLVFLIYFNSLISFEVFLIKVPLWKFFGVLIVFLVNEVYTDFIVQFRMSSNDF